MNGLAPLIARLVLAGVFLYAGVDKALHPQDFAGQIAGYRLLPASLVTLAAVWMPWLELLAGSCLAFGFLTESSAVVLGALSLLFASATGSAMARGLNIECGCFSTTGSGAVTWGHVLFDLVLVGLAVLVLAKGPGPWAMDRLVPVEPVPRRK